MKNYVTLFEGTLNYLRKINLEGFYNQSIETYCYSFEKTTFDVLKIVQKIFENLYEKDIEKLRVSFIEVTKELQELAKNKPENSSFEEPKYNNEYDQIQQFMENRKIVDVEKDDRGDLFKFLIETTRKEEDTKLLLGSIPKYSNNKQIQQKEKMEQRKQEQIRKAKRNKETQTETSQVLPLNTSFYKQSNIRSKVKLPAQETNQKVEFPQESLLEKLIQMGLINQSEKALLNQMIIKQNTIKNKSKQSKKTTKGASQKKTQKNIQDKDGIIEKNDIKKSTEVLQNQNTKTKKIKDQKNSIRKEKESKSKRKDMQKNTSKTGSELNSKRQSISNKNGKTDQKTIITKEEQSQIQSRFLQEDEKKSNSIISKDQLQQMNDSKLNLNQLNKIKPNSINETKNLEEISVQETKYQLENGLHKENNHLEMHNQNKDTFKTANLNQSLKKKRLQENFLMLNKQSINYSNKQQKNLLSKGVGNDQKQSSNNKLSKSKSKNSQYNPNESLKEADLYDHLLSIQQQEQKQNLINTMKMKSNYQNKKFHGNDSSGFNSYHIPMKKKDNLYSKEGIKTSQRDSIYKLPGINKKYNQQNGNDGMNQYFEKRGEKIINQFNIIEDIYQMSKSKDSQAKNLNKILRKVHIVELLHRKKCGGLCIHLEKFYQFLRKNKIDFRSRKELHIHKRNIGQNEIF